MLSTKEMIYILENKLIDKQTDADKKQIFDFAFGADYIASSDKGSRKTYRSDDNAL